MKEFQFISKVKIANDVSKKYPNYKINCFTPKTLAKRFVSGNSEKQSLRNFGFEYKTVPLSHIDKLFVVQKIATLNHNIETLAIYFDKKSAQEYLTQTHIDPLEDILKLTEIELFNKEVYRAR